MRSVTRAVTEKRMRRSKSKKFAIEEKRRLKVEVYWTTKSIDFDEVTKSDEVLLAKLRDRKRSRNFGFTNETQRMSVETSL